MSTPILPFAVWASGTNQNSIPANDNSLRNQILNGLVISDSTDAQPGSPSDGDIYIMTGAATGTQWATFDEFDLAIYNGGTWYAFAPSDGVVINLAGALMAWDGAAYTSVGGGGGGGMTNPMTTAGDIIYGGSSGTPTRLAAGSDGQVLTLASGSPAWAASSPTNWTTAVNTSAPNATIPTVSFTVSNAAANVDAAIISKGTGATLARVADNSTPGGNKRGQYATDFQKNISANTQVASGNYSAIVGGQGNTASGTHSFSMGQSCAVSGNHSAAFGASCTVSGNKAYVFGDMHVADGAFCMIYAGRSGTSRSIEGVSVQSDCAGATVGTKQRMTLVLGSNTVDATQTTLSTDSNSVSTAKQLTLPNNGDYLVTGAVIARQNTTGDSKSWTFVAHIKRGANAAATAMVAPCTPSVIASAAGASAWALDVDADTTNGCLRIRGTGEAAKSLKWVCSILDCAQVVG